VDLASLIDGPALASLVALSRAYMSAKRTGRGTSRSPDDIQDATLQAMPGGPHVAVQSPAQEAEYLRKVLLYTAFFFFSLPSIVKIAAGCGS
jgi:hypothetical protein